MRYLSKKSRIIWNMRQEFNLENMINHKIIWNMVFVLFITKTRKQCGYPWRTMYRTIRQLRKYKKYEEKVPTVLVHGYSNFKTAFFPFSIYTFLILYSIQNSWLYRIPFNSRIFWYSQHKTNIRKTLTDLIRLAAAAVCFVDCGETLEKLRDEMTVDPAVVLSSADQKQALID